MDGPVDRHLSSCFAGLLIKGNWAQTSLLWGQQAVTTACSGANKLRACFGAPKQKQPILGPQSRLNSPRNSLAGRASLEPSLPQRSQPVATYGPKPPVQGEAPWWAKRRLYFVDDVGRLCAFAQIDCYCER